MEKTYIICPGCGKQLGRLLGKLGQRRRLRTLGGARVRLGKNALGEELAWIRCPKCRTDQNVNPAHWDAGS
jgi:DNA-directed RNA polymerase subunit RPC12/RpoP